MLKMNSVSILLVLAMLTPIVAKAQSNEADDLDVIELELDKDKRSAAPSTANSYQENAAPRDNNMTEFSGLSGLAPFKEISVIQKRFLPKTGRFQLFGGVSTVTNDPFFLTFGGSAKASYFMSESWGIEFNYLGLSTSNRKATDELKDIHAVRTENLVYPRSYFGADLMYIPVYGKMTWFNDRIVPFDLYLSVGGGSTNTQLGENAGTLHLATGQIFALSKAYAVRWDFSWNFFNAKDMDGKSNSYNNLLLTVGMSWFFPEASYR